MIMIRTSHEFWYDIDKATRLVPPIPTVRYWQDRAPDYGGFYRPLVESGEAFNDVWSDPFEVYGTQAGIADDLQQT